MDKFVTKTPAPPRPARLPKAAPVYVQTRIEDMRHVVDLDSVRAAHAALSAPEADARALSRALADAESLYIALEILEETGIGRAVFKLTKHADAEISERARALFEKWRRDALTAWHRRKRREDSEAQRNGAKRSAAGGGRVSGSASAGGGSGVLQRAAESAHDLDMTEVEELEAAAAAGTAAREQTLSIGKRARVGESMPQQPKITSSGHEWAPPALSSVLLRGAAAVSSAGGGASAAAAAVVAHPGSGGIAASWDGGLRDGKVLRQSASVSDESHRPTRAPRVPTLWPPPAPLATGSGVRQPQRTAPLLPPPPPPPLRRAAAASPSDSRSARGSLILASTEAGSIATAGRPPFKSSLVVASVDEGRDMP